MPKMYLIKLIIAKKKLIVSRILIILRAFYRKNWALSEKIARRNFILQGKINMPI